MTQFGTLQYQPTNDICRTETYQIQEFSLCNSINQRFIMLQHGPKLEAQDGAKKYITV